MSQSSETPSWSRRLLWAAAAQSASSTTNFALYVGLLVVSASEGFGRWVAVLAVYHLAVALARALAAEPMVAAAGAAGTAGATGAGGTVGVRRHGPTGEDGYGGFSWSWARRRHLIIGATAAVGASLVGWRVGADGPAVTAVVVAIPFLLLQDGLRSLAWARGRPDRVVIMDGVWIVTTGGLLAAAVITAAGRSMPTSVLVEVVLASWLAGGLASALVGGRLVGRASVGGARRGPAAAARHPSLERRLHARRRSQALLTTARNLLPIAVATVVGPVAAGLLKAALLPYLPILSLQAGLRMVVLPGMQRAAEASFADPGDRSIDRFVTRLLGAYLAAVGLAVGLTLVVVEALVGRLGSLGEPGASGGAFRPELARWGAVIAVTITLATVLADGIGFGRRSGPVVGRRLVEIAVEWSAVFAGVALLGPEGAVIGWAVGVAAGALLWLVPALTAPSVGTADRVSPGEVHSLRGSAGPGSSGAP